LRLCLKKNAKNRRSNATDVRLDIEQALAEPVAPAASTAAAASQPPSWRGAVMLFSALILGAVGAGGASRSRMRPAIPRVIRTTIETSGPTALSIMGLDRDLAVTPDGSRLVYRGTGQILVRSLDQLVPTSIAVGNARGLFVSPDGQWIGFFDAATAALKK